MVEDWTTVRQWTPCPMEGPWTPGTPSIQYRKGLDGNEEIRFKVQIYPEIAERSVIGSVYFSEVVISKDELFSLVREMGYRVS